VNGPRSFLRPTRKIADMANKALVAEKVGMTQLWRDDKVVPVTVLRVPSLRVVQIRTPERDGYSALQVTYGTRDPRKINRPTAGHYEAAGVEPGIKLVELRLDDTSSYEVGQQLTPDLFAAGERIDITAVSRGKGFAGVMKRHNFSGQKASHGTHRVHRKPGAVGACATPSRVFPGQRMAGRMGGGKVTTLNIEVVEVDTEAGLLLVRGSVPGARGGRVIVRNAVKYPVVVNGEAS
jgi:large subunit ribosomal protein L3